MCMCLTCFVLFVPSFFSLQHLHLKEAVTATAADFEDDFEEKSPSAKSFSLRGAVAAASAEDAAAGEEEELKQWWKPNKVKIPTYTPPKFTPPKYTPPKYTAPSYSYPHGGHHVTPPKYPTPSYSYPHGGHRVTPYVPCSTFGSYYACRANPTCQWRSNSRCVPENFEDEEFDTQDLEKFDAPEGEDQYYYYANDEEDDEEDED